MFFMSSTSVLAQSVTDTKTVLDKIDGVISRKQAIRQEFSQQQTVLRRQAQQGGEEQRAKALEQLFHLYVSHQCDSALVFLSRMEMLSLAKTDKNLAAKIQIGRAETFGVMGFYNSAAELLEQINSSQLSPDTRLYYHQVCRTVYGWMTSYGELPGRDNNFAQLTDSYRDSILAAQSPGIDHDIVMADKLLMQAKPRDVIALCERSLSKADARQQTFLHIMLADAYKALGQDDLQRHYLALAALSDLERGVTEYVALPRLALLLSNKGDALRAYRYLL